MTDPTDRYARMMTEALDEIESIGSGTPVLAPMTPERRAEIREEIDLGTGTLSDKTAAELLAEVERLRAERSIDMDALRVAAADLKHVRAELDLALAAADPSKIERVRSIIAASTRLVRIERDAERKERDRLTAFVNELRDLAFVGGQSGEIVRRSILRAFTEFDIEVPS